MPKDKYTLPNKCYDFPDNGVRLVGSLQDVLKDGDSKMLWIRPLSLRGSGMAFVVDEYGDESRINFAWPFELRYNNIVSFSAKQLAEDWEIIEPDAVFEEHVIIAREIEQSYEKNGS